MEVLVTHLVGGEYNTGIKDALKTRSIRHKYNSSMLRETEGPQAEVDPRLGRKPGGDDALLSIALPEILLCLVPFPPRRMKTAARDKRQPDQLFLRLRLLVCGGKKKEKALTFELFSGRHLQILRRHRPLCIEGG